MIDPNEPAAEAGAAPPAPTSHARPVSRQLYADAVAGLGRGLVARKDDPLLEPLGRVLILKGQWIAEGRP